MMRRAIWLAAASIVAAGCHDEGVRVAVPAPVEVGGVTAQPGWPCPACFLALARERGIYELGGTIEGAYFTEHHVTRLSTPVLRTFDRSGAGLSSVSVDPASATGTATMAGVTNAANVASASLTWLATYDDGSTGYVAQDVAIQ